MCVVDTQLQDKKITLIIIDYAAMLEDTINQGQEMSRGIAGRFLLPGSI